MRTPCAIYPYCSSLLPVVRHFHAFQNTYILKKIYTPVGWVTNNKDAAYLRNHPKTFKDVSSEINDKDNAWETLIYFHLNEGVVLPPDHFTQITENAIHNGKKIVSLDAYGNKKDVPQLAVNNYYVNTNIPVVFVGGLLKEADTLEVTLSIVQKLRDDGLSPIVFSNSAVCELFGFHNYNAILKDDNIPLSSKVEKLNIYINDLVHITQPDVIVLHAPDAVMRYNDYALNGCGIETYLLCQAMRIDYFICCIPCNFASNAFVHAISNDLAIRLGSPIHAVHVSNIVADANDVMFRHKISYTSVALSEVQQQIAKEKKESEIPLYDVISDGIDQMYAHLFPNM